ncbi:endonuclease/exonuclease/phosphatase family protein, partial [Trifolium medium]|nr:endonuclease/exonuclease/phosphatase family protein [Trifolium medium]
MVFAKFGRVGEVYLPNKVDKWGRRFGFVKYKEVNNLEELIIKLGDVWCGSYKLRINLSKFGRNHNQKSSTPPPEINREVAFLETPVCVGKSFKEVLGEGKRKGPLEMDTVNCPLVTNIRSPPLFLEPDLGFLHILESSYVGRLVDGKNIKTIQLNLCMEGFRRTRVASMGDGLVLVFSETGEDVEQVIGNKVWWEGLLEELKPWFPNMVATKRDIWVRLHGVPLQLWSEGGFKFVIRVVEERGGPMEFVHVQREEDQLGWSVAVSSCDSGMRMDRGPELAMAEGDDFDDSESDMSGKGRQKVSEMEQEVHGRLGGNKNLEVNSQTPFRKAEMDRTCS